MEEIGSEAMLTAKKFAGVVPEVTPREHVTRIPLPSVVKSDTLELKPRGLTRSPKQGYQWAHKRTQKFKNKTLHTFLHLNTKSRLLKVFLKTENVPNGVLGSQGV